MNVYEIAKEIQAALNNRTDDYGLWPRKAYGITWVPNENKTALFFEIRTGAKDQETYRVTIDKIS